jgi:CubicO group peptidase (beta-lactamase class C family)
MNRFICILFCLLFSCHTFSQKALEKEMTVYEDSISAKNYGMVGLYKTKRGVQKFSIGKSSPIQKMNNDNVFNIGSLTKTFTAILILQEIENKNLTLQDSLISFFPRELCSNLNVDLSITIEQLLRHTSGLGEVITETFFNQAFSNPYHEYNYSFLFNKIPASTSKANLKYEYCNTNYLLLGYVLEVLNDKPYSELLKERIFEPTKMKNSYAYYSKNIKNVAHPIWNGEDLSGEGYFKYYQNYSFSAGGISSNTDDLNKFFSALYGNKLISKTSFESMITFGTEGYGIGLETFNINKQIYFGHGGDNLHFKIRNFYNPKSKELLILIANQFNDKYIMKVARKILK